MIIIIRSELLSIYLSIGINVRFAAMMADVGDGLLWHIGGHSRTWKQTVTKRTRDQKKVSPLSFIMSVDLQACRPRGHKTWKISSTPMLWSFKGEIHLKGFKVWNGFKVQTHRSLILHRRRGLLHFEVSTSFRPRSKMDDYASSPFSLEAYSLG